MSPGSLEEIPPTGFRFDFEFSRLNNTLMTRNWLETAVEGTSGSLQGLAVDSQGKTKAHGHPQ